MRIKIKYDNSIKFGDFFLQFFNICSLSYQPILILNRRSFRQFITFLGNLTPVECVIVICHLHEFFKCFHAGALDFCFSEVPLLQHLFLPLLILVPGDDATVILIHLKPCNLPFEQAHLLGRVVFEVIIHQIVYNNVVINQIEQLGPLLFLKDLCCRHNHVRRSSEYCKRS